MDFESALFVRQLKEAGHVENDAARGLFFAAEALVRDINARDDDAGIAALDELHLEIHSIWENHFNARLEMAGEDGRMAGLVSQVINGAAVCPDPHGITLRPAHRKGVAHRLVENAQAGWVRHWRDIATEHSGDSASDIVANQISSTAPSAGVTK
jgi:hypothetical protein